MRRRAIGLAVALVVLGAACGAHPNRRTTLPADAKTAGASILAERVAARSAASKPGRRTSPTCIERMESLHPDLYHGVSKAELAEAAHSLVTRRCPALRDDQILVGADAPGGARQLRGPGRAHGHVAARQPGGGPPVPHPGVGVPGRPVRHGRPRARTRTWSGRRIIAIDGVPIEEVLRRLDPVVPRDNDSNLRAARSVFLTSAEVLSGLGIATDPTRIEVEVTGPERRR